MILQANRKKKRRAHSSKELAGRLGGTEGRSKKEVGSGGDEEKVKGRE